jgi:hypothetical protein
VNYTLKNDSGMNLNMAVLNGSISIGACTDVLEVKGALPKLNEAGRISGSYIPGATPRNPPSLRPARGSPARSLSISATRRTPAPRRHR